MEEINEARYFELLEAVPPIYISELDGNKIKCGFAVGEPMSHTSEGNITCTVCYCNDEETKYYIIKEAVIKDKDDKPYKDVDEATWSRGNKAYSIPKKTIHIKFKGIDDWNWACFKVIEDGSYIGSTDKLFNYDEKPEVVIEYFKNHLDELCYFGKSFGCEPMGNPLKSNLEIIINQE